MVELPEAVVLTKQINSVLVGKKITNAIADYSPHKFAWYTGDPADYGRLLYGKTIRSAETTGTYVEIKADDIILHITTPLKYHAKGEKLPQKHQLLLEFEDSTAASASIQMWGHIFCYREGDTGDVHSGCIYSGNLTPIDKDFVRTHFHSLLDSNTEKLSAKAFLATEQRIPGIGNGVLQDILWRAQIHPKCKMGSLSAAEIDALYDSVKAVLEQMIQKGGRDTEKDLFGHPGGYKTVLCKNTVDTPCPVCGTYIKREAYLGGSIYYCEGCQPL